MRAIALSISVLLLYAASGFAKDRHCTLRIHAEANANDTAVFSSQSQFSGRNVLIEKVPAISERDVMAFYPYRANDGSYGALFQLDDHGRLALDALSILAGRSQKRRPFCRDVQSRNCKSINAWLTGKSICLR